MIGAEVSRRVAKLMPLLGSSVDGEVLGAARAMGRVLAAANADWHDLAGLIGPSEWQGANPARRAPAASPDPSPPPQPGRTTKSPKQYRPSFGDLTARQARETIAEILSRQDLSRPEVELLQTLDGRLYARPHEGLSTSEVRAANRIWRRCEADVTGMAA